MLLMTIMLTLVISSISYLKNMEEFWINLIYRHFKQLVIEQLCKHVSKKNKV
jgi:hypothetical protein